MPCGSESTWTAGPLSGGFGRFQLRCIQGMNSFMFPPGTATELNLNLGRDEGNWQEVQETGRTISLPLRVC
jgi:hypothetical protein